MRRLFAKDAGVLPQDEEEVRGTESGSKKEATAKRIRIITQRRIRYREQGMLTAPLLFLLQIWLTNLVKLHILFMFKHIKPMGKVGNILR